VPLRRLLHAQLHACHGFTNATGSFAQGPLALQELVRIETGEEAKLQYVPHFGYNSLLPLALQLVPWDSPDMQLQLQHLQDPQLLWTKFGLRSLAKSSSIYHKHNTAHDAPYWRGAIWINMNFLVLRSLKTCSRYAGLRHCQLPFVVNQTQCMRHSASTRAP
jgi:hypothetical protein